MKNNLKISVIIPTYNRAFLLPRAIKSVLNQTFQDFELIIIDDGSTDNTKDVVEEIKKKDKRIIYIYQDNQGLPKALNTGIKNTKGKYIAFLESDDEWLPEKLEEQIKLFRNNIGIVSCNLVFINEITHKKGVYKLCPFTSIENFLHNPHNYIYNNSSIIISRVVAKKIGLWDESLKVFSDLDYYIRIIRAGYVIDFVKRSLVKYYIHDNNLSRDFNKSVDDYLSLLKKHEEIEKEYPIAIYASYLRRLGTMCILNNNRIEARKYFKESVKLQISIKNIIAFLLSYMGHNIYIKILNIRKSSKLKKI